MVLLDKLINIMQLYNLETKYFEFLIT